MIVLRSNLSHDYTHTDPVLALAFIERLADDMCDTDNPIEVRSLGRTLRRWKHQIAAWLQAHVSNGPTEAANNLIKRVKRAAFGFTSFRQLPDQVTSVRRQAQLGAARDDHAPVKSGATLLRARERTRIGRVPRRQYPRHTPRLAEQGRLQREGYRVVVPDVPRG